MFHTLKKQKKKLQHLLLKRLLLHPPPLPLTHLLLRLLPTRSNFLLP